MSALHWISLLIVLLFVAIGARAADPAQAVVLVYGRTLQSNSNGQGFIIGDGSLVVTSHQSIFGHRERGNNKPSALVEVISPYLGDVAEARIIAQDPKSGLVLLQIPWNHHPALPLADEGDIAQMVDTTLVAYPSAAHATGAGDPSEFDKLIQPSLQALPVDFVAVRRSATCYVQTKSAKNLNGSWLGCPMLVAKTNQVCACLTGFVGAENQVGATTTVARGATAAEIRALVPHLPAPTTNPLAPGRDAREATNLFLKAWAESVAQDPRTAAENLKAFLNLRPTSASGYTDLAAAYQAMHRPADAESAYKKALALEPQSVWTRVMYGQLLVEQNQPSKALDVMASLWEPDEKANALVIPMCNLLLKDNKHDQCIVLLKRAFKNNPDDGLLWLYLAQCQRATNDHLDAAESFARAANLMPERTPLRADSGGEFQAAGRPGEAENQYQKLIDQDPQSPAGHFLLARLLAQDVNRLNDALEQASQALRLSDRPNAPPRDAIEDLIAKIRAQLRTQHTTTMPSENSFGL